MQKGNAGFSALPMANLFYDPVDSVVMASKVPSRFDQFELKKAVQVIIQKAVGREQKRKCNLD